MRSEEAFHSHSIPGALSGHVHSYRRVHGSAGSERLDYDRSHHARRSRRPVWPAGCCDSYLRRGNRCLSAKGFRCISSPCANPNDPGRPFGNGDDQNRTDEFRHQHPVDERQAPKSTGSRAPHSIRCARHSAGTQPVVYPPPHHAHASFARACSNDSLSNSTPEKNGVYLESVGNLPVRNVGG